MQSPQSSRDKNHVHIEIYQMFGVGMFVQALIRNILQLYWCEIQTLVRNFVGKQDQAFNYFVPNPTARIPKKYCNRGVGFGERNEVNAY